MLTKHICGLILEKTINLKSTNNNLTLKVNVLFPAPLWCLSHLPPSPAFNLHQLQSRSLSHREVGAKNGTLFLVQHNHVAVF